MPIYRGADFWVGYLSHTVALAATGTDLGPALCKDAIKEFVNECPDPQLVQAVKSTLKEKP